MRVGYLECFAGIAGDMLMAALVDAGAPAALLQETAASLGLGAELRISRVNRSGIQSTRIEVLVDGRPQGGAGATGAVESLAHAHSEGYDQEHKHDHPHTHDHPHQHDHAHPEPERKHDHEPGHTHNHGRNLSAIRSILLAAPLSAGARRLSLNAFAALAEAEARIHGIPVEEVHFHEVGAVDAIVDIACSAAALDSLNVDRWYCSPVNVGSGFVNCAHGRFPVPAPASAELLKNVPIYSAGPHMELATPTGAALLRALDCSFEPIPVLRAHSIGYGAGTRDPERFPNVLRLTVGEVDGAPKFRQEIVMVLECALDDLSPQIIAHTGKLALERGALDVMSTPVTMKKGRVGTLMTVLCKAADAGGLQDLLFRETSTLGIRVREENRLYLDRQTVVVETEFGVIGIKVGMANGEELNAMPEFEDCCRAAEAADVPLKTVMQAALAQWRQGALSGVDSTIESPAESGIKARQ